MNTLVRGVVAVTGCVLLAGAGIADTSDARDDENKNDATDAPRPVRTPSSASKLDQWSMRDHANPHVGKEETKDLLRAKRPK